MKGKCFELFPQGQHTKVVVQRGPRLHLGPGLFKKSPVSSGPLWFASGFDLEFLPWALLPVDYKLA